MPIIHAPPHIGASIVIILVHAALHTAPALDSDEGEIEVTMEEVSVQ